MTTTHLHIQMFYRRGIVQLCPHVTKLHPCPVCGGKGWHQFKPSVKDYVMAMALDAHGKEGGHLDVEQAAIVWDYIVEQVPDPQRFYVAEKGGVHSYFTKKPIDLPAPGVTPAPMQKSANMMDADS